MNAIGTPCPCGGQTKYHQGLLGYEAYVCQKCGEHWSDRTEEDYLKHVEAYKAGDRNGVPPPKPLSAKLAAKLRELALKYPTPSPEEEEQMLRGGLMREAIADQRADDYRHESPRNPR